MAIKIQLTTNLFEMASRKAAQVSSDLMWKDLGGVFNGLRMIAQAQQSLPAQRTILPQRRVSKAQRQQIEKARALKEFQAREKADEQRFEQEVMRQQMEALKEQQLEQ